MPQVQTNDRSHPVTLIDWRRSDDLVAVGAQIFAHCSVRRTIEHRTTRLSRLTADGEAYLAACASRGTARRMISPNKGTVNPNSPYRIA